LKRAGVWPGFVTFVRVMNACASLIVLEEGRFVHHQIIQSDLASDVFVENSLIDIYAKSGSIEDAWNVFCHTWRRLLNILNRL